MTSGHGARLPFVRRLTGQRSGQGPGWALAALAAVASLCCGAPAPALEPGRALTQYGQDVWRSEEGLPQRTVLALAQTPDGYLWIGSPEGLARFDGVRFTTYSRRAEPRLPSREARRLLVDRHGRLWVGADRLYRLESGDAVSVLEGAAFPGRLVQQLLETRDGSVWVLTDAGLFEVEDRRVRAVAPRAAEGDRITALCEDGLGRVWVGTSRGLATLEGGRLRPLAKEEDGLPGDEVRALVTGPDGTIWVGTADGLLAVREGRFARLGVVDGLCSDLVGALLFDREGSLWVGTNRGLNRLRGDPLAPGGRKAAVEISSLTSREGLSGDGINALMEDREGSLWIGTEEGGLSRLRDVSFTTFGSTEGLGNEVVRSVLEGRDGGLWIGGYGRRLHRLLPGGRIEGIGIPDDPSNDRVTALAEDREGTLWVGTLTTLLAFREGRFRTYGGAEGLSRGPVLCILAAGAGRVWAGTPHGLARLEGGRARVYTTADGLPSDVVRVLHEDRRGRLWAGTDGGLALLEGERFLPVGPSSAPVAVWAICEDEGQVLWLGTAGSGLVRFDGQRFRRISLEEGLFDDMVYTVLDDGEGALWMSSNNGIFRLAKAEIDRLLAGQVKTVGGTLFGMHDGLRSAECNGGAQPAGGRTRDGRLWFPTVRGVASIEPRKLRGNPVAPPVVVEELLVDGQPARGHIVRPGARALEIRYTAGSLRVPRAVRFRYRMEGLEEKWVEAGTRRSASYSGLWPGRYRFVVTACNEDGVWSESGASYELELRPRFHQTMGFRLLLFAGVLAAAVSAYALRMKHLRARYEAVLAERARVARELHDTLAQELAGAVLQIENARDVVATDPRESARYLEKAREAAREGLAQVRCSLWALRSEAVADGCLLEALVSFARERAGGTAIRVEGERIGPERRLPARVESHLLRIGQEAVVNAIRHGLPATIRVRLVYEEGRVSVTVEDDGRGFDVEALSGTGGPSGRFGLVGLRERVEELGGRLAIRSVPGRSTHVGVSVPV